MTVSPNARFFFPPARRVRSLTMFYYYAVAALPSVMALWWHGLKLLATAKTPPHVKMARCPPALSLHDDDASCTLLNQPPD